MSKKNELSFDKLINESIRINQVLPSVSRGITALDEQISQGFETLEEGQDSFKMNLRQDIQDLKTCMAKLEALKEFADNEDDRQVNMRSLWQEDLKRTAGSVQRAIDTHLELQVQYLGVDIRSIIDEELSKNQAASPNLIYIVITSIINLIGSGISGAIGAVLAISVQDRSSTIQSKATTEVSVPFNYDQYSAALSSSTILEQYEPLNLKLFQCDYDPYSTVSNSSTVLEQHNSLHLQRFKCDHCQEVFVKKSYLKRHILEVCSPPVQVGVIVGWPQEIKLTEPPVSC